jgi:aldehyde dehydrogenase (NAD+)
MDYVKIVSDQRDYFNTDATRDVAFRKAALRKLYDAVVRKEAAIFEALKKDLNKCDFEAYMSEVGIVREECRHANAHLGSRAGKKRVSSPLSQFPSSSFIMKEPYGVALIMSPWNYPFQLTLCPLIGAIAAGNCAVIKPSAYSPATSQVIADLIADIFPQEYITVVQGGRQENAGLLEQKFDYIFFTGSTSVGRLVMEKASVHLTPVTLELGGKSPAIIDSTVDLKLTAKRICWGKFLNGGQTCVAPDYVLIEESVRDAFLDACVASIKESFPEGALKDPEYVRIINEKQFARITPYLSDGTRVTGGGSDPVTRAIEPTILRDIPFDSPVMREEIFGPILPVISFSDIDAVIRELKRRPKPLALYIFSRNKNFQNKILRSASFGGGCINDTVIHLVNAKLGFGGVGDSGMGAYHGKRSFDTFTHEKGIIDKKTWLDLPMRYRPYKKFNFKLLRFFLR